MLCLSAKSRLPVYYFRMDEQTNGRQTTRNLDVSNQTTLIRTFAIVGFLMYTFMGNSENWDMMIEMEANMTASLNESLSEAADCIGEACETVQEVAAASVDAIREEF